MNTTPLPPAIEPVAWFEYARKKPTLKRLVFDRTSRSQLRVAGWVSEPLVKESDATKARADLEAENKRLREALKNLADEFVRVYPIYYYAELWSHNTNVPLLAARAALENKP